MPDLAAEYTFDLPTVADVVFNENGLKIGDGRDGFYITDIKGLGSPPLRTPTDNAPQTDGGLVHRRFKGPRIVTWEFLFKVESTQVPNGIVTIWNQMEATLIAMLEDIETAAGTVTWTPLGQAQQQLSIMAHVPFEPTWQAGFKTGTFGTISADPTW